MNEKDGPTAAEILKVVAKTVVLIVSLALSVELLLWRVL